MIDEEQSGLPYFVASPNHSDEPEAPKKNKGRGRAVRFNEAEIDFGQMELAFHGRCTYIFSYYWRRY